MSATDEDWSEACDERDRIIERIGEEYMTLLAWAQRAYLTFKQMSENAQTDDWQAYHAAMFYAPDAVKAIDSEKGHSLK